MNVNASVWLCYFVKFSMVLSIRRLSSTLQPALKPAWLLARMCSFSVAGSRSLYTIIAYSFADYSIIASPRYAAGEVRGCCLPLYIETIC